MGEEVNTENMSPEQIAEMQKQNCVFCKIIKGEIPSHKVYEDDRMIAILDIYPSTKGHILVMPKDHVPIMPLLPGDVFKHIFSKVKSLSRGVREGMPSERTTIFVANGGVAGQQSPHFLFHIIPRDRDDGLINFDVPQKKISQNELVGPIKAKLGAMMGGLKQKQGVARPGSSAAPGSATSAPNKEQLANMLEQNPFVKELIMKDPDKFLQEIENNPQLKQLFNGINVHKLSEKLKEIESGVASPANEPSESIVPDTKSAPVTAPVATSKPISKPSNSASTTTPAPVPTPAPAPAPVSVPAAPSEKPEDLPELPFEPEDGLDPKIDVGLDEDDDETDFDEDDSDEDSSDEDSSDEDNSNKEVISKEESIPSKSSSSSLEDELGFETSSSNSSKESKKTESTEEDDNEADKTKSEDAEQEDSETEEQESEEPSSPEDDKSSILDEVTNFFIGGKR